MDKKKAQTKTNQKGWICSAYVFNPFTVKPLTKIWGHQLPHKSHSLVPGGNPRLPITLSRLSHLHQVLRNWSELMEREREPKTGQSVKKD